MWGQVLVNLNHIERFRIIPTRVGTSYVNGYITHYNKDHPHACGDKKYCGVLKNYIRGSSPRVWGQVLVNLNHIERFRIIPTRVGTRCRFVIQNNTSEDHPHACGDKSRSGASATRIVGSSPRVWGQVEYSKRVSIVPGIIPTRVGTSY